MSTDEQIDHAGRYVLKVRDLASDQRPREKLLADGAAHLTNAELVAVIFGSGTVKEDVMSMATRVMSEYGESALLTEQSAARLAEALQLPPVKACQLLASLELGRRYFAERRGKPVCIRSAAQAARHLGSMAQLDKEQLRALYLSSRYEVIHDEIISIGSLTASIIHPREIFEPALRLKAAAIIIAHNHPSGDMSPTNDDRQVTNQLVAAGQLLGIELVDHLIISESGFKSVIKEN